MICLTKKQVVLLHSLVVAQTGGSDGIRDEGLLDSAIGVPMQSFDGKDLYPTVQTKAAMLAFRLINNHPFVDGNKRIGAHVMLVLLALNGIELNYKQEELYTIILDIASGAAELNDLTEWILNHQL